MKKTKLQSSDQLLIGSKPQGRRKTLKLASLMAVMVFVTIPLYYYPSLRAASFQSLGDPPVENTGGDAASVKPSQGEEHGRDMVAGRPKPKPDRRTRKQQQQPKTEPVAARKEKTRIQSHDDDQSITKKAHFSSLLSPQRDKLHRSHRPIMNRDIINDPMMKNNPRGMIRSRLLEDGKCDLFTGEWVPNPEGPYYTNETCNRIQDHQNCLKFGRPDRGFLKWRWKPDDCELPIFEPRVFLELVRGKSLAFVGDSVARNHMQSLICLLTRVAIPEDLSNAYDQNQRYEFKAHDFNISLFWSPYLVRASKLADETFNLYLDEFDEHWTAQISLFDYVIISAGQWFFRPTYFYLRRRLVGCLHCKKKPRVAAHVTSYFSYRRAFRTALRAINDAAVGFGGVAFLRTYAPSHFEGGPWDKGGDCTRTRPYGRNEAVLEDYSLETYLIQLEELRIAQRAGRRTGGGRRLKLFDTTKAMMLRADGHPSKYGRWPGANRSIPNDCVHWCLPGPIDSWNDMLQELLSREKMR